MNKATQSVLMAVLGGFLISITVTGRYTAYVKPGFAPLLLIAGAVLIVVGVASIASGVVADRRAEELPAADLQAADSVAPGAQGVSHGHSHEHSKAPWLILAPILVLFVLAPPALGADAVSRNAGSQALAGLPGVAPAAGVGADVGAGGTSGGYAPNDGSGHGIGTKAFAKQRPTMSFPPLPGGTPSLSLKEFVLRALYDGQDSVSDNDVTVTGFIAPAGDGYIDGYSLARMTISCCAADANPMRVHVTGTPGFPVDTWVTAVLRARPGSAGPDNEYVPTVEVTSMSRISQPTDPYEH